MIRSPASSWKHIACQQRVGSRTRSRTTRRLDAAGRGCHLVAHRHHAEEALGRRNRAPGDVVVPGEVGDLGDREPLPPRQRVHPWGQRPRASPAGCRSSRRCTAPPQLTKPAEHHRGRSIDVDAELRSRTGVCASRSQGYSAATSAAVTFRQWAARPATLWWSRCLLLHRPGLGMAIRRRLAGGAECVRHPLDQPLHQAFTVPRSQSAQAALPVGSRCAKSFCKLIDPP